MSIQPYIHHIWLVNPLPLTVKHHLALWNSVAKRTGYTQILWVDRRHLRLLLDLLPEHVEKQKWSGTRSKTQPIIITEFKTLTGYFYYLNNTCQVTVCCYEDAYDFLLYRLRMMLDGVPIKVVVSPPVPDSASADKAEDSDSPVAVPATQYREIHATADVLSGLFRHAISVIEFEKSREGGRLDVASDILRVVILSCMGGFYFDGDVCPAGIDFPRPETIFTDTIKRMLCRKTPESERSNLYENDILAADINNREVKAILAFILYSFQLSHPEPDTRIKQYESKLKELLIKYGITEDIYKAAQQHDRERIFEGATQILLNSEETDLIRFYKSSQGLKTPAYSFPFLKTLPMEDSKRATFFRDLTTALGLSIYNSIYGITQREFRNGREWEKIGHFFDSQTVNKTLSSFMAPGIGKYDQFKYAGSRIIDFWRKRRKK